uniref:Uncharacterized protein n=1 Tax=uncultured prokaryote TaxID=198431 RepID=A0A0H5Q2T4_9ZZZZ|nr:hypothetical protein [uncultured prokaryote]
MLRIRSVVTGVPGSPAYINMFFGGSTQADAQEAADRVTEFFTDIKLIMSGGCIVTLDQDVPIIDPASGNTTAVVSVDAGAIAMSVGSTIVPRVAQILIQLATGAYVGSRAVHGRLNIPFANAEALGTRGEVSPTVQGQMEAAAEVLRVGGSAGNNWGVFSPKNGVFYDATDVSVWREWAILASRRD